MERNLALELVRVTEAAALAAARWMGKGDGDSADLGACEFMEKVINSVRIKGTVVIGEKLSRSALKSGSTVGAGGPPDVDVALDPLESIDSVAFGRPNAISIIAVAERGGFFTSPVHYMDKIAVGPEAAGVIDMNAPPEKNLVRIADAKRCYVEDLTVCILERDRHKELIERVRDARARIQLIPDGDVAAAIAAAIEGSGVDVLMGVGGSDEGVLTAAALKCVGGDIQGRLVVRNEEEEGALKKAGIASKNRVLKIDDLVRGENVMFAATGVTNSDILAGVQFTQNGATTHSIVMRRKSGTIRFIKARHFFHRKPDYF